MKTRLLCSLVSGWLLFVSAVAAEPAAEAAGLQAERNAAGQLQEKLTAAAQTGVAEFTIPPGKYRFPLNQAWTLASWEKLRNLRIVATGATFIFEAWKFGLLIKECENLELDGLTIEYDPLPYTQGKVLAIHSDPQLGGSYFDYQTDPGFLPLEQIEFDPVLKKKSEPLPVVFFCADGTAIKMTRWGKPERIENLGEGIYRIHLDAPSFVYPHPTAFTQYADYGLQVGDRVVLQHRTSGSAILLFKCSGVTLKNVRVYSSPGGAFTDLGHHDWRGGQRFENCVVGRKPESRQLLATNGDAYHSYLCRQGPQLVGCRAEYVGDDFFNLRGTMSVILETVGLEEMIFCLRAPFEADCVLYPGAQLKFYAADTGEPRGETRAKTVEKIERPDLAELVKDSPRTIGIHGISAQAMFRVRLETPVAAQTFDNVLYPETASANFRIENCVFANGTARGGRIQTGHGLFAGNTVERVQGPALSISMQCQWLEGGLCEDLEIRGNRLSDAYQGLTAALLRQRIDCAAVPEDLFATVILLNESRLGRPQSQTWPNHSRIVFANNEITATKGPGFFLANATQVTLQANQVTYAPGITPEIRQALKLADRAFVIGRGIPADGIVATDNRVNDSN